MLSLMLMKGGKYTRIPDPEEESSHDIHQQVATAASAQDTLNEPQSGGLFFFRKAKGAYMYGGLISLIFVITLSVMSLFENGNFGRLMTTQNVPFDEVEHPDPPQSFWKHLEGPLPTGAFWTNFVVDEGQAPANLHPYGVKCLREGVQVSYNPTRRVVNELVISDPFDNDLELSASEEYIDRKVARHDPLSVTMHYSLTNGASYAAHLVKGAAMVTVSYSGATPMVKAPNMQIINVEERGPDGKRLNDLAATPTRHKGRKLLSKEDMQGRAYLLDLGNFQKWLVYVSDPTAALVWDKAGNSMTSKASTSGFVRIAVMPPLKDDAGVDRAFAFLLRHVGTYPTGAKVDLSYSRDGSGTLAYRFSTDGIGGTALGARPAPETGRWLWPIWLPFASRGGGSEDGGIGGGSDGGAGDEHPSVLMYALPHHTKAFTAETCESISQEGLISLPSMYSLKGRLTPVLGSAWSMTYTLADKGWDYYMRHDVPSEQLDVIAKQLIRDVSETNKENIAPDSYNFGKQAGRMAMLAGLADYLGILEMRDEAVDTLRTWLTPWLEGTNDDKLVYDKSYGGMVTTNGISDKMADYGMGWYNDHHFHFGYHIYAYAMVARFDKGFLTKHKLAMDAVVADVCNPQQQGASKFPYVRHKDFFDGHSWASGIFSMSNGKGQESSSEAVNAYYACYLYGMTAGDELLKFHSQFMLTLEVEAVKMYWHMPNSDVYDSFFSTNVMVGNVGAFDVTCTTWFGSNLEYVHGIQIMPVTPATGLLLEPSFVKKEWPLLAARLPESERGPSANSSSSSEVTEGGKLASVSHRRELASASCADSPRCAALGLDGDCCPNAQGEFLDCCASSAAKGDGRDGGKADPPPYKPALPTPTTPLNGGITAEWRAIMFIDLAVIDRDAAFKNLVELSDDVGSGASKTNAFMWTISRPEASYGVKEAHAAAHVAPQECAKVSACDASGMQGNCCPNDDGGELSCCPKITGILQE